MRRVESLLGGLVAALACLLISCHSAPIRHGRPKHRTGQEAPIDGTISKSRHLPPDSAAGVTAGKSISSDRAGTRKGQVSDYWRSPASLGLLSVDYSIVRAFVEETWRGAVPDSVLNSGTRPRVDDHLDRWTFQDAGNGLSRLGVGRVIPYLGGVERIYRDNHGTRLIAEEHTWTDTLILSSKCRHDGQLVRANLGQVRTSSGLQLGDRERSLVSRLGQPDRTDRFKGYRILWYLSRPERAAFPGPDAGDYEFGNVAAYAVRDAKVVEIWLHAWSTDEGG